MFADFFFFLHVILYIYLKIYKKNVKLILEEEWKTLQFYSEVNLVQKKEQKLVQLLIIIWLKIRMTFW